MNKDNLLNIENIGEYDINFSFKYILGASKKRSLYPSESQIEAIPKLQSIECLDRQHNKRGFKERLISELKKIKDETEADLRNYIEEITDEEFDKGLDIQGVVISESCSNTNLGNKFDGSLNKFDNLIQNNKYSDINNYLMMQASIKTYPHQLHYQANRSGRPNTNRNFRCATKELYKHWGFKKIQFINTMQSANAVVASNKDIIIIAIRGTEQVDSSNNIDNESSEERDTTTEGALDVLVTTLKPLTKMDSFINPINYGKHAIINKSGKIHFGYSSTAYVLSHHIRKALMNIPNFRNKKIYITGHSLGGAIAILSSYFLQNSKNDKLLNIKATYAFASPEIGDSEFVRNIYNSSSPYYMTINYRDPIPSVNRRPLDCNHIERVTDKLDHEIGEIICNYIEFKSTDYVPSINGSHFTNFFDFDHLSRSFRKNFSHINKNNKINSLIGEIKPVTLPMKEWHFHNPNFYLAYTYNKLISDGNFFENEIQKSHSPFIAKANTGIEPEFSKSYKMCIKTGDEASEIVVDWSGSDSLNVLLSDRQTYPFSECN